MHRFVAYTLIGDVMGEVLARDSTVQLVLHPIFKTRRDAAGTLAAALGKAVATGEFGAAMQVALVNDGPVTIWLDSHRRD
jgi:hypothetical protein